MTRALCKELGLGPLWRLRGAAANALRVVGAPIDSTDHLVDGGSGDEVRASASLGVARFGDSTSSLVSAVGKLGKDFSKGLPDVWGWSEIKMAVSECVHCRLCEQRNHAVVGVGDQQADWLFVGEGPGAEEDLRDEPFVGQAGKLLDAMLAGLGIARGHGVYIANAVKCRPPNNRTPEPDEIEACFPYLQRQIELIRPRVIVALGRPAAQALLKQEIRIGAARGQVFRFGEIPVVVTYHPAYLLRNPADKGKAWADLCFARKTLASSPPKVKETV